MRRILGVSLVLLSMVGLAERVGAQQDPTRSSGQQTSEFSLQQNYPNPFGTDGTTIPFTLGDALFAEGRSVLVSMRIYNLLQQFVAVPLALRHERGGVGVQQLEYIRPGEYEAHWDGLDQNGRPAISGVYWIQLEVNGMRDNRRMFLSR